VTTSGGFGHATGTSMAFACVDSGFEVPGTGVEVELVGDRRPATVPDRPAYDPGDRRLRG
jgi:dimethylglycine dehydrogenase